MLVHAVSRLNFFSHFDHSTRYKLLSIARYQIYKKGDFICDQESLDKYIYVVVSGAATMIAHDDRKQMDLRMASATLFPGDHVGAAPLMLIRTNLAIKFHIDALMDVDFLIISKNAIPLIL